MSAQVTVLDMSLGGQTMSLVPAVAKPVDPEAEARVDYELAAQIGTREAWDSFLASHPTGLYANLARAQNNKLAAAQQSTAPAAKAKPPAPGAPKGFALPRPTRFTLPNGMKATLVQWGSTPKVTVELEIAAGNGNETPEQVWLADLTAALMREGTATRTGVQISEEAARTSADAGDADLLRAAIGFSLGGDTIGLGRFREKYARKMIDGPDGRAFDVLTNPAAAGGPEFRDVARSVATIDTLESFLQIIRSRSQEGAATSGAAGREPARQTGAAPQPASLQTTAR